ncbi:MAG: VWA domain-containing protein [Planctomycetes bacterium]|nr:VWA domain-containing protein [Planctomycetota bacterium]
MEAFFASPHALWLGLLAGPLLLLFMLRHKPVRKRVASVALWTGVAQSQIATSPFQRLRKSLSLILLLVALLLLVLALAGFRIPGGDTRGVPVVLVLDVTASMGAQEKGGSRLDLAKRRAAEVLDAAGNSTTSLFAWDGNLRALTPADAEPSVARDALTGITASEYGASDAALARALEQIGTDKRRVVLFSDHSPGELSGAHFVPCGTPKVNAAIVSASLSEVTATQVELFFGIELSGSERSMRAPLLLEKVERDGGSRLEDARDVNLVPGRRASVTFAGIAPGLYSLRIKIEDALALDNIAWLRFSALPVQDVVFTGDPPTALARAAEAIESEMGMIHIVQAGTEDRQRASYVFSDAASSGVEPRLPSAYLGPLSAPRDVAYGNLSDVPDYATRPAQSFLWRGAGAPDIRIPKILELNTSRYIRPVLEAGPGPAIGLATRENDLQDLLVAFPLDQSAIGFTGKLSFLIFWANWFDYVRRAREPLPRGAISTREAVKVRALTGRAPFRYAPINTLEFTTGAPGRVLHFDRTGVYEFKDLDETELPLAGVSLLDASESNLARAESAPWEPETTWAWMQGFQGASERRDLELRPWLALLVAALLLFEWFWFRRRFPTRVREPRVSPRRQSAASPNSAQVRA